MTTTSSLISAIDTFVAAQNANRSGVTPLDYDALTGTVPAGGNGVTGIAGIAAGAAPIAFSSSAGIGNTVIVDGGISTSATTSGPDSYSLFAPTSGAMTLTDNNTGNAVAISNASEIVFNLAATTSGGAYQSSYIVATGNAALIASIYGAGLEREPDFAGLDFYLSRLGSSVEPDLHAVATFVLASKEEAKLYPSVLTTPDQGGPNDRSFVTDMYSGILHRTPTSSEVSFYVDVLAGTYVDSSGKTLPAVDRATVLEYFATSPENQANISAATGGWLINPAKGQVNLGGLSAASASPILNNEISSGTINAADFASLPANSTHNMVTDVAAAQGVSIFGPNPTLSGRPLQGDLITANTSSPANLTVNLTSQYFMTSAGALNETVNGVPQGGSLIITASTLGDPTEVNAGGTINLSGGHNAVELGSYWVGNITTPAVIHGWNSTDILATTLSSKTVYTYGFATNGQLNGSAGVIQSGGDLSAYSFNNNVSLPAPVAVNVGTIANDSTAAMVTAINQAFHVLDQQGEEAFFFGQDLQGNTMVFYWRGDNSNTHSVVAADLTGAVELVGVQASSLTGANFHN